MRRIAPIIAALAAALPLAVPATASANAAGKIVSRCTHGKSIGGFPARAYREALRHMPTEVAEYSECAELISNAQLAAASHRGNGHGGKSGSATPGGGSSGSGGGPSGSEAGIGNQPIPTSPAEHEAVLKAKSGRSAPVRIAESGAGGGPAPAPVQPGVVHADLASAASSIPTPLLAVLALLAALALAAAGRTAFLYARRRSQGL